MIKAATTGVRGLRAGLGLKRVGVGVGFGLGGDRRCYTHDNQVPCLAHLIRGPLFK